MQFSFEIVVGKTKFTITENAENHKDFIKKASFFTALPTQGPNGEDDLKLVHRVTTQGHEYFSIVSETAKKEFKLGQAKDMVTLYPKGWDDLFVGQNEQAAPVQQQTQVQQTVAAPVQQAPAPTPQAAAPAPTPVQQAAPVQQAPAPTLPKVNTPPAQQAAPIPTPNISNQATTAPANTAAVNAVLQKYGIQNNQ